MTTFYLYTVYKDPITDEIHNNGADFYKVDCDRDEFIKQIVDEKYQDNLFGYDMEHNGRVYPNYWLNASGFHSESYGKYFISAYKLKEEFVKQICNRLEIGTRYLTGCYSPCAGIFIFDEDSAAYDGDYEVMDNFTFMYDWRTRSGRAVEAGDSVLYKDKTDNKTHSVTLKRVVDNETLEVTDVNNNCFNLDIHDIIMIIDKY